MLSSLCARVVTKHLEASCAINQLEEINMENTNSEIKESDQESSIDKANALNRLAHVLSICNIFSVSDSCSCRSFLEARISNYDHYREKAA